MESKEIFTVAINGTKPLATVATLVALLLVAYSTVKLVRVSSNKISLENREVNRK